jgi:hypothetical protein
MSHISWSRRYALAAAALLAFGRPADAQVAGDAGRVTTSGTAQVRPSGLQTGWEIEGYGGLSFVRLPDGGTSDLPGPGASLPTSSPLFPTRQVSSWFFGDGAVLLSDVNAAFGSTEAIVPLDGLFGSLGLEPSTGGAFGFRVRREVTPRYSAEFSVDVIAGATTLTDDLLVGVDASRESFGAAFDALLASGPFTDPEVVAAAIAVDGASREVAVTGSAIYRFTPGAAIDPYVTLGGGLLVPSGEAASVTLEGQYRAVIGGTVRIEEFDRVALRFDRRQTWIGVVGGGVSRTMANAWGLRVDGRVLLGAHRTRLLLDASPEVPTNAPAGFIESGTNPAIQFSNDPATGRLSSLSGPGIRDFVAFEGDGLETRFLFTIGVFWKF